MNNFGTKFNFHFYFVLVYFGTAVQKCFNHFGLAFTATGSNFCQPKSVPKLSFSKFYIQQNFTVRHAQCTFFTFAFSTPEQFPNQFISVCVFT